MTEIQETIALGLQVAERLWVPCSIPYDDYPYLVGGHWATWHPLACPGKVYPLREPCKGYLLNSFGLCKADYPFSKEDWGCPCGGERGWIANTSYDSLRDAVEAKGWEWNISTHQPAVDLVLIHKAGLLLGRTAVEDELRGKVAILKAVLRALEKEDTYPRS